MNEPIVRDEWKIFELNDLLIIQCVFIDSLLAV